MKVTMQVISGYYAVHYAVHNEGHFAGNYESQYARHYASFYVSHDAISYTGHYFEFSVLVIIQYDCWSLFK